jgi:3-deoxy-manno-octulosonate cytidylyltransferase (CMP-KDO synthetase)
MGSFRLPGKPMIKINGIPMIIHVYNCAQNANLDIPIIVATDDQLIAKTVNEYGGTALITSNNHLSGSDRIFEALEKYDPNEKYKKIIHLQGDLPNISGELIKNLAKIINDDKKDMVTIVVKATPDEFDDPSIVKAAIAFEKEYPDENDLGRALYFSRACIPYGSLNIWHHIGIYAWQRDILKKYINLQISPLEKVEQLEQLRALEAGIDIHAMITYEHPIGVDTEVDLNKAIKYFQDLS